MSQILLVAQLQFIGPAGQQILGVSDAPYIDPDSDSTLFRGCYWPVITNDIAWSEHARHAFQDQAPDLSIGDITLDNHGRLFDDWPGYTFSGLRLELKRGPASTPWADLEPVLIARMGPARWIGREAMVIQLRSVLEGLNEPLAREVFDEGTPNANLINTVSPLLLGQCYQLRPAVLDPAILRYYIADNMTLVFGVQEGGNPTENWEQIIQGFQLTQNATLGITCHAAGPPLPEDERVDVIADIGGFETWDSGDPDGWDVRRDPPYSEITEVAGGAEVESTAELGGDLGLVPAGRVEVIPATPVLEFEPVGAATLTEALEDPNVGYAQIVSGGVTGLGFLQLFDFDLPIPTGQRLAGIELEIDIENAGSGATDKSVEIVHFFRMPDGTTRGLPQQEPSAPAVPRYVPTTRQTLVFGGERVLPPSFSQAVLDDPAFESRWRFRRLGGGVSDIRVHAIRIRIHHEPDFEFLRLRTKTPRLVPGNRYLIQIDHGGSESDSIRVRWSGTTATGEVQPPTSSFSRQSAVLAGDGVTEETWIADGTHFAIKFDRGDGNGEQLIRRISVIEQSLSLDRYRDLVPYIVGMMGYDPADHVDQAMIDAHDEAAGNMPLGWYVNNNASADQVLFRLAASLGGPIWAGLDGKVRSFLMLPPEDPGEDHDYLVLEDQQIRDDVEIWDDQPPNITDRAVGARNWHPIPEDRAATITSTWTEQDRQDVAAEWRVTRKAQFPELDGFESSVLSITSIDPTSGLPGTPVTITGTGFEPGAEVYFGDDLAEEIVVVNSTTITCEVPEPE